MWEQNHKLSNRFIECGVNQTCFMNRVYPCLLPSQQEFIQRFALPKADSYQVFRRGSKDSMDWFQKAILDAKHVKLLVTRSDYYPKNAYRITRHNIPPLIAYYLAHGMNVRIFVARNDCPDTTCHVLHTAITNLLLKSLISFVKVGFLDFIVGDRTQVSSDDVTVRFHSIFLSQGNIFPFGKPYDGNQFSKTISIAEMVHYKYDVTDDYEYACGPTRLDIFLCNDQLSSDSPHYTSLLEEGFIEVDDVISPPISARVVLKDTKYSRAIQGAVDTITNAFARPTEEMGRIADVFSGLLSNHPFNTEEFARKFTDDYFNGIRPKTTD